MMTMSPLSQRPARPTSKANLLASHFSSCFSQSSHNSNCCCSSSTPCESGLSSVTCTSDEVHNHLCTLNTKTASSPDGLSSHMLRNTASAITLNFLIGLSPRVWYPPNGSSRTLLLSSRVRVILVVLLTIDLSLYYHYLQRFWNELYIIGYKSASYLTIFFLPANLAFALLAPLRRLYSLPQMTGLFH